MKKKLLFCSMLGFFIVSAVACNSKKETANVDSDPVTDSEPAENNNLIPDDNIPIETPVPIPTPTPTPALSSVENPLDIYPTVTYDDIATGQYNGQYICIECIVDNVDIQFDTSCEFSVWYPSQSSYVSEDGFYYDVVPGTPESVFLNAQKGDVIKYATQVYDDGSFGTTVIVAAEIVGTQDLTETSDTFKEECAEMNYEDMQRNPDNYKNTYCKISGTIFQIVDEGPYSAEYLLSTDYGYVYISWFDDEDVRGSRFLEEDSVTIYGEFL